MSKTNQHNNQFYQRDILEKWRASGLSQAAFCRQEGIPEWALSNWKRRELRVADEAPKQGRRKKQKTKRAKPSIEFAAADESLRSEQPSREPAKFVPLRAEADPSVQEIFRNARRTPVAEIAFGEVSVRIWRGADLETVQIVLAALKEYYTC